jgi:1-phosphatidylinositol-4-phosphate 5-kinase
MVKSITIEEFKCLSRILPALNTYLTSEPRSFLARLLGAHSITIYNKQIYFVVMTNSLYTGSGRNSLKIHERYDLKGAWDNRNVRPLEPGTRAKCIHCNLPFVVGETRSVIGKAAQCPERPTGRDHEPSRLFLDNDLNRKVTLQVDLASRVKEQLTRDSQFLESQGLLDYSMLLGVHRRRCLLTSESLLMIPRSAVKTQFKHRSWNNLRNAAQQQPHQVLESKEDDDDDDDDDDHNHTNGQKTLPITIPLRKEETTSTPMQALRNSNARQSRHCRFGEHTLQAAWVEGPALYWISIIDILQEWTWKKRLERIFKMIFRCKQSDGFCAVPPDEYGRRFRIRIVDGAFESADVATTSSSSFGGGDIPLHPVDEKEEEGIDNNDDGNSIPPSPPSSPLR